MDKIFLRGIRVKTLIGLYEWERKNKQTIVLDLELGLNASFSCSDDIADTVHYGEVCTYVRQDLAKRNFLLLERLAEHIAQTLFTQFAPLAWLRIKLVKPGILADVDEVGVEIERFRIE